MPKLAPLTPLPSNKIAIKQGLRSVLLVTLGIFSAAFGLKSFLIPSGLVDGGATGVALLMREVTGIRLHWLLLGVNLPFIYMGYKSLGVKFALQTLGAITGLALVASTLHFPEITQDKLLVSVFGGFFLGAGIGLAVRGGAVLDGTEVLAISLSRRLGLSIGDVVLLINIIIFGAAALLLSLETAMYSVLTYLTAAKTVDFIIEGIEEYTGATIISARSEELRVMITEELGRGVTVYKGSRGYRPADQEQSEFNILYTVITRLEVAQLNAEIEKIDPNAFVVMHSIKDTRGGMIKKRPFKH
jgi:uncharacterized membrane-anchored protein YitT (DUF2179 family)